MAVAYVPYWSTHAPDGGSAIVPFLGFRSTPETLIAESKTNGGTSRKGEVTELPGPQNSTAGVEDADAPSGGGAKGLQATDDRPGPQDADLHSRGSPHVQEAAFLQA